MRYVQLPTGLKVITNGTEHILVTNVIEASQRLCLPTDKLTQLLTGRILELQNWTLVDYEYLTMSLQEIYADSED